MSLSPAAPTARERTVDPRFLAIALLYLLLGIAYSLATPVGEGPDEASHLAYVAFLQREGRLPRYEDARGTILIDQVKHPPLYYAALALVTRPGRLEGLSWFPNPHCCNLERPSLAVTRHVEGDLFPYAPAFRAIRLARGLTLLMGLVAVWATYAAARVAFPRRPALALAGASGVAFLPQFLFIQGVVNNDGLANAFGALALLAALRLALGNRPRHDAALLGLAVGLGIVTKLTMLAWLGVAVLAIGAAGLRAGSARVAARAGAWFTAPMLVACGWWLAWNKAVQGEFLGMSRWRAATQVVARRVPLREELPDYFALQWQSFWGRFGWVTLRLPDGVYGALGVVSLLALLGLALAIARRRGSAGARSRWAVLILLAGATLSYAAVFRMAFDFDLTLAQGRYLFTALPAFAILFALGLLAWSPPRHEGRLAMTFAGGMLALATFGLGGVLWPAFRPPARLSAAALAAIPHPLDLSVGPAIRLLGYGAPAPTLHPGDRLDIDLYWSASRWVDEGDVVFVHVLDSRGEKVGQVDALPGGGRYPTFQWYPGRPWRDRLSVPILPSAAPGAAQVLVGLYPDGEPGSRLRVSEGGRDVGDHVALGPVVIGDGSLVGAVGRGGDGR